MNHTKRTVELHRGTSYDMFNAEVVGRVYPCAYWPDGHLVETWRVMNGCEVLHVVTHDKEPFAVAFWIESGRERFQLLDRYQDQYIHSAKRPNSLDIKTMKRLYAAMIDIVSRKLLDSLLD